MALQSQVWSSTTPMPMAESSLYRQRLQVIAEKRRLQEEIRAARLELEEEKLRVQRLKRKSLRERWLMDGAAEEPDCPKDPASQDPQSPEGQAQARIQNLEDSLFTLQSQLQLLQSASTGAQHKPLGRPTWRRQGHRPLSQPSVEPDTEDLADLDKRASLPPAPASMSPESPSEPRDEAVGVLPTSRPVPGVTGASSEANGPCPVSSPPPERQSSKTEAVGQAKQGGVVKVVWEGLRATEDCALEPTGPELEAKVEEMVLEAIGARQGPGSPELPSWVKEDRDVVEVVWEGLGGTEGSDSEGIGEGGRSRGAAAQPRLPGQLQGETSREGEGADRSSPEGGGQGGSAGEEGSFIWVERVALSEEWEELQMEGAGPVAREGGADGQPGTEEAGGAETWEVERRRAEALEEKRSEETPGTEREETEEPPGRERQGGEGQPGQERDGVGGSLKAKGEEGREDQPGLERVGVEGSLQTEEEGREDWPGPERVRVEGSLQTEEEGREDHPGPERVGVEGSLQTEEEGREDHPGPERVGVEGSLQTEEEGREDRPGPEQGVEGEEQLGAEKTAKEPLDVEGREAGGAQGAEKESWEEELRTEKREAEEPEGVDRKAGSGPPGAEPLEAQGKGGEEDLGPGEQGESGRRKESQELSEAGAPLGAQEEPRPEEEELQPQEKQEGSLEEEAAKLQTTAESQSQGATGDAMPLLAETSAQEQPAISEQPAECQPLLSEEGPSAKPSAHPVPTYAPARQPEPPAPAEGEEASGPKQKTCQCCAVM
ncbi:paralemmin-3 [Rhynchocyon petersi]